jgi:hypothetical protein
MPEMSAFDYAIIRVVPHVEREEFINAGIILFCRAQRYLDCRISLTEGRLLALSPDANLPAIKQHLDIFARICAGGDNAGPIGKLNQADRFHWLTGPRSTTIQVSPVHPGMCTDPQTALEHLFGRLVR